MTFILTFIVLSIINVIFSTARSIVTIKGGKLAASLMSGGYFAFYNVMLIFTVADFPMWQKCIITFVTNVIGVYIVKLIEDKMRKSRLWKVEMTVEPQYKDRIIKFLNDFEIPCNYIDLNKWIVFNVYCETQKQSSIVKEIANECKAKYFVSENKGL